MAQALQAADKATVLLGNVAMAHPQFSVIKALAAAIAEASGAILGVLTEGANGTGGWLAGVLPQRGPAGNAVSTAGLDAQAMLAAPRKGYLLFGVEPAHDCANAAQAIKALDAAEFVVSIAPFVSDALKVQADVLLPTGPFTETSGTFVNTEGRWQSFSGIATPKGDSRPGWKVLRVLGNQFGLDGFEQQSSEAVRDALREQVGTVTLNNSQVAGPVAEATAADGLERIGDVAINATDALVRRAPALQATPDATVAGLVRLNAAQAEKSGVQDGYTVTVKQGAASTTMDVEISERVPDGCVWLQAGTMAAASLGAGFGPITIERV
jgi:NADH-quinone oxidoreductase subunit G